MRKITTSTITEEYMHPAGTVHMSISLLTKLFEWAKNESTDDVSLHRLVEFIAEHSSSGRLLTMDDYSLIVPDVLIPTENVISK